MSAGGAGEPPDDGDRVEGHERRGDGDGRRSHDEVNGSEEETAPQEPGAPRVAAAAPTAITTAGLPKRRRHLVPALVLVLFGAVAVGAVVFFSGDYRQDRELTGKAEAILVALATGEAEHVYDEASTRFQQTLLIDTFLALVKRMDATLGRFERVTEVLNVDRAASVAGMTGRVVLELRFETGITRGQFSFHRGDDGVWRLLGLNVEIPPGLEDRAAALEAQQERLAAPDEVVELVNAILEAVREGRAAEVHENASPSFKNARTVEGFEALLQSQQAGLGNFVRVLGIVSSAQSPNRGHARVQALLEYEKARTTGTFEFVRKGGAWRLHSFKIVPRQAAP